MTHVCFDVEPLDNAEIYALRAVYAGDATPNQQRLALVTVANKLARSQDLLFIPGANGDRESAFLSGRAFVGQQLLKVLKLPLNQLEDFDSNDNS